ncbi:MAG: Ig-like domain-containing protein, partial [Armatimonadetes bacterium]|nr:Ig-like domain-containing protein [Armatimonadota bacterium]
TVSSTVPAEGATGVAIDGNLTATFSAAMDPATITTATFTLKQGATVVAGAVTYAGMTA